MFNEEDQMMNIELPENIWNIDLNADDLDLDTTQFWDTCGESTKETMTDRLLKVAQSGGTSELISILEKESSSASHSDCIDLNIIDNSGWTPLHHSSFNGHLLIVEHIIKYQHNKVFKENNNCIDTDKMKSFLCREAKWNGSTALHLACARGHELIVTLLIDKMMTEYQISLDDCINVTDNDMRTPLHCAVLGRHYAICVLLLKYKVNINKADINGKTPLDFVKEKSMKQYLRLFNEYAESSNNVENTMEDQENTMENKMCHQIVNKDVPINQHAISKYHQQMYSQHQQMHPQHQQMPMNTNYYNTNQDAYYYNYQNRYQQYVHRDNRYVAPSYAPAEIPVIPPSYAPPQSKSCDPPSKSVIKNQEINYDPALDAIRFQNKYLRQKCDNLENEHKELAFEYRKQLNEESHRWKVREKQLLDLLDTKQKQIHELRNSLRKMRMTLDNLPVKMRRNFYRNNSNFSKDDDGINKENKSNDDLNKKEMKRKHVFTKNITSNSAKSRQSVIDKSWRKKK